MRKIKISELPLCKSLKGLFTIGTDKNNQSVKVPLEFIEDATTAAVSVGAIVEDATRAVNQINEILPIAQAVTNDAKNSAKEAQAAAQAATDASRREVVKMSSSDNAVTLLPWKMYEFPEMAQLRVTLSEPKAGELNEWQFSFNSAASATVLSLPANIVWASAVSIVANMHYEVNVVYNESAQKYYGMMIGWAR